MSTSSSSSKDVVASLPPVASADHRWIIIKATYDDLPLIIRLNSTAREWLGHASLGIKLGFAVPLNAPDQGGLPTPEENQELNDLEDIILQEVDRGAKGIYALILTTGTMREFVFYVAAGANIGAIHQAIQRRVSTHDVQCMAVKDPAWDAYTRFAPKNER